MSDRKWVPSSLVDEITPPGRAHPNDWIVTLPGDARALDLEDPLFQEQTAPRILREGEPIDFDWIEDHGGATFTIAAGAAWWRVDRQPPPGTTHICAIGEPESLDSSLEDFAKHWGENNGGEADEFEIAYYTWSEAPVRFIFRAGAFIEAAP